MQKMYSVSNYQSMKNKKARIFAWGLPQELTEAVFLRMEKEIMDNFDFSAVQKTMKLLKWKWGHLDGGFRTPNLKEIKDKARKLLRDCYRLYQDCHALRVYTALGGFLAEINYGILSLAFEVTSWDVASEKDCSEDGI